jgi:hypothetical protein
MVVSQPWIRAANPTFPPPSSTEISQFMESESRMSLLTSAATIFKTHPERAGHCVNSNKGVVPIDLVISKNDQP